MIWLGTYIDYMTKMDLANSPSPGLEQWSRAGIRINPKNFGFQHHSKPAGTVPYSTGTLLLEHVHTFFHVLLLHEAKQEAFSCEFGTRYPSLLHFQCFVVQQGSKMIPRALSDNDRLFLTYCKMEAGYIITGSGDLLPGSS